MAEVDRTGLDILCKKPGDIYMPPKGGLSVCISKDGTILICDSKTDTCTRTVMPGNEGAQTSEGMMTSRLRKLVKELNDRVDRLEAKLSGKAKKSR